MGEAEQGKPGERYILGGQNMTLAGILAELSSITGRPAPKVQIPYALAWMAGVVGTAVANVTGKPPRAPMEAVRMAKKKMWVTHAKATAELGYHARPAHDALADAVRWFSR